MNQAEQQIYFDGCQKAFVLFEARHPEYEQSEASAKRMAAELKVLGLSPLNHEHLEIAWQKVSAPAPQPAPVEPETSDVEKAARAAIASGEITVAKIESLTTSQYELASRNEVFCRALEILIPRREASLLTQGDLAHAAGLANLSTAQGFPTTTAEKVEELSAWKKKHFDSISTASAPAAGASLRGITDPSRDMPIRKPTTQAQFDAAIRQSRSDQQFIEAAEEKAARVRRVKKHKASR